jgi:hypothetical protein
MFKRLWHTVGNVGNRLILPAGFGYGFVLCAQLIYKAGLVNGSYHSHINSFNFEKWLKEKLTPNIQKDHRSFLKMQYTNV